MKKGWTTTKLIATGALAVLGFIGELATYYFMLAISGSAFAGIVSLFVSPFFVTLAVLIIDQVGTALLYCVLNFILSLPVPKLFPVAVNLITYPTMGFLIDCSYSFLNKHRRLMGFCCGAFFNFVNGTTTIILFFVIGLPGTKNIPHFITTTPWLILIEVAMVTVGGLSGLGAYLVYEKLSNTNVVRRIQGKSV